MLGVSKNSLDLIGLTGEKLRGKYSKAFLATLILLLPIMICVFSFYLIPVAVLFWGVLQTGYIRYMRDLIDDKQPSIKVLFSEFSNPGLEILLGTVMVCMFTVGTILLIVPGIILVAYFSMSLYFAENKKANSPLTALKDCSKHMKGNFTNMLSFKVLYWLVYVILVVLGLSGVIISSKLWANYKVLSVIVFALDFIFTTLVWSAVTVHYQTTTELFFRELLVYNGQAKVEENKVEVKEEVVEAPVVEKTNAEPKTKTVKASTAKTATATKKPATKTTTTKKPAAKTSAKSAPAKTAAKKTTSTKKTTSSK